MQIRSTSLTLSQLLTRMAHAGFDRSVLLMEGLLYCGDAPEGFAPQEVRICAACRVTNGHGAGDACDVYAVALPNGCRATVVCGLGAYADSDWVAAILAFRDDGPMLDVWHWDN